MSDLLAELVSKLATLPEKERQTLFDAAKADKSVWTPTPGPQTLAYFSKADILLFGGEPGGGKSDLILGLAFNEHQKSLIMRRNYTDLGAIVDRAIEIHGSKKGFNGSPPPSLRINKTQHIEFGAAAKVGDEFHFQGRAHDFIGFDEGTQFAEQQIKFLMGWLRSTNKSQRKRVVIATNPPLTAEGLWVTEMFAPWLNKTYPNPAKFGELRWFITDVDGKDKEVPGPELVDGVQPLSRTFIPSSVSDNPYLAGTNYDAQLHAMPEPFRSILMGRFKTSFRDQPNQVIPTDWIKAAQARWTAAPRIGVPMCAIGVDVAAGGEDETVLAPRYDGWYSPLVVLPGKATPLGSDVAGLIISKRKDNALVIIDVGGGYGNGAFEHMKENNIPVVPYNGANGVETRTKDRQLKFYNKRAETWWRFREALDPDQQGGSTIMLPDDPKLLADLSAPTFEMKTRGILVESKEDIKKRLGRSPDRGDAVVMAYTSGAVFISDGGDWLNRREQIMGKRNPKVLMGRRFAK